MKLSALVEDVNLSEEEIVITKHGRSAAVLVSPNELDGWRESIAIRFDTELIAEIKKGLQDLEGGNASLCTLEELF